MGGKSDWIDLRAAETVELKKGEFCLINLGVAMSLPDGYDAVIVARSSTFGNYGIIQTNCLAVIDETYGKLNSSDVWRYPVYATRDTKIGINERICQFRIQKHQPEIEFIESNGWNDGDPRSGVGSTGRI